MRDLALEGHALLGCKLDGDRIADAIHIPNRLWKINSAGQLEVDASIAADWRQRLIYIPLGADGILTDGVDTIRQARALDLARTQRMQAPPPGTTLKLNHERYAGMTSPEKREMATNYAQTRLESSVSVVPPDVDVSHESGTVDLFESATNSIRLDIANHASVPASIIEGARSGSGGEMSYSNTNGERSEIYDLGSRQYADAIAARLSLDDVCEPGTYIAFDTSVAFTAPTPTTPPVLED